MEHNGTQWNIMEHNEHNGTQWNTMKHKGTQWNTMEHNETQWNTMDTMNKIIIIMCLLATHSVSAECNSNQTDKCEQKHLK